MNQNEERANLAFEIVEGHSDQNYAVEGELTEGMRLDITDTIANLLHLGDRYGLDVDELLSKARDSYAGDSEDGPRVKPIIGESNA